MRPPLSDPSDVSLIIHRLGRVASTQDEARRLFDAGEAAAGHVIVADAQDGTIVHQTSMAERSEHRIRSSVVAAGGNLFIRTNDKLYCIGK